MNKEKIVKFLKWFFHSYIWVGILLLIVDIISKNLVANLMMEGDSIELIPNFLSLTYTINRHAAFGIGPENPVVSKVLYIVVAGIASIGIIYYYSKNHKKFPGYLKAALMIIVAGAIGNMIDRIFYSPEYLHAYEGQPAGVVDFIDFFKGSALHNVWHYIFNIADCGVVIGVIMLAVYFIIEDVKESKQAKAKNGPQSNEKVLSESEKQRLEEQEKNRAE